MLELFKVLEFREIEPDLEENLFASDCKYFVYCTEVLFLVEFRGEFRAITCDYLFDGFW